MFFIKQSANSYKFKICEIREPVWWVDHWFSKFNTPSKKVPINILKLNFFFTVINNQTMILSWRLPLLESELSNKLKSIRMVVVSKDHNHSQRPKIAVKQGSEIIRRFQLPPKPQYILINVKSALKYQQVPMKKEISFTLHGRFIVSWNTRKNISNN